MEAVIQKFLYVIGNEDGPVKIGRAAQPIKRRNELQVASASHLELLFCFHVDEDYAVEQAVHLILRESLLRGEWFNVSASTAVNAIRTITDLAGLDLADVTATAGHGALIRRPPGRPKSGKCIITMRMDSEVLTALKARGANWSSRANDLLRANLGI